MCDCIKRVEEKVADFWLKDRKDITLVSKNVVNKYLTMTALKYSLFHEVKITYRKGQGKREFKTFVNIINSYCPFCGEKVDKGEGDKADV